MPVFVCIFCLKISLNVENSIKAGIFCLLSNFFTIGLRLNIIILRKVNTYGLKFFECLSPEEKNTHYYL